MIYEVIFSVDDIAAAMMLEGKDKEEVAEKFQIIMHIGTGWSATELQNHAWQPNPGHIIKVNNIEPSK